MPIPTKYLAEFAQGHLYHVYNRTNNKELLFLNDENKRYFLQRFREIQTSLIDTYCWCLLPNHFHLLIRVKTEKVVSEWLKSKETKDLTITEERYLLGLDKVTNLSLSPTYCELIEKTFKRFFQAYALAFNKQHQRRGNLFYKPFKRVLIENDSQFTMTIIYIHANAMKHRLVKDFTTYQWSSWHTLLSNQPTQLAKQELLDWFGSLDTCIKVHQELSDYYYACDTAIEDE